MPKFPVDVPKAKVVNALRNLGFEMADEREHISMVRQNSDGTRTPLTMPNHRHIKGVNAADDLPAIGHQPRRIYPGV